MTAPQTVTPEQALDSHEALLGLLAVIHRDGGHYTAEHGVEKAVKDAHEVWAGLMGEIDALRARLARIEALLRPLDRPHAVMQDSTLQAVLREARVEP